MRKSFYPWLSVILLITIALSACGGAAPQAPLQTENPATVPTETSSGPVETSSAATEAPSTGGEAQVTLPEVNLLELDGEIIEAGSSTVYPLAEAMANRFKDEGFGGQIALSSIGSGAGFERFCVQGETDISNASRPIKDSEVESCQSIGREPIEFRVGTDALAITVSQKNDFIENVTLEELAKIFSRDATNWSDVNPDWPNEAILRYIPGTDSGTFDYFVEAVMAPVYGEDEAEAAILDSPGVNLSEDDNVLVQGVLGSPYAIGFFGFAYYQENTDTLKVLSVDGVEPTEQTAESSEYPLARPLFIYSDVGIMNEKPQVAGFINFFLTYVNDEILDVGYFPASSEALDAARQKWLDAVQ
jgi:phosphate transport system substrate-binding protein